RLETEEGAALVALRDELPTARATTAEEPGAPESAAASPTDAWTADERRDVSAYLDSIDATDKAHAAYMKAVREMKKIDKASADWSKKAGETNGLEQAWKDAKATSRKQEDALRARSGELTALDAGRKAGRDALRKRLAEAVPTTAEPVVQTAEPLPPEQPTPASEPKAPEVRAFSPETGTDVQPADSEHARLIGEIDELTGKYGPLNGMDLAFKDILGGMSHIKLGGPAQMARVSAEAQRSFEAFGQFYTREARTVRDLLAAGKPTAEQADSAADALRKMERAAQTFAEPLARDMSGGMRRFADTLRAVDARYDSTPLVKAADFIVSSAKKIEESTARIRTEWERVTEDERSRMAVPPEPTPENPAAGDAKETAETATGELFRELDEIGDAELTAAADASESLSLIFGALEERAAERRRVREFTDALFADVSLLDAWKDARAADLASLANGKEPLATMSREQASEFLGARAQEAETAETEIRAIKAGFEERFRVANEDLDGVDGNKVMPFESENLDRLAAIVAAVAKKRDGIQTALATLANAA
ncbi:hypothetical protein EBS80_03600, partial [bacterium]|nr:hypothetical protein [bacterium]